MKGLVLSGGGVKGAFQAGVLDKIRKSNPQINYDFISGVSVGAINSVFLAQYKKTTDGIQDLLGLWKDLESKDLWATFIPWPPNITWLGPLRIFFQDGLFDTTPLLNLLKENVDLPRLRRSGKKLRIGVVEKTHGEYFEVTEKTFNLLTWTLASASFPFAMKSVIGKHGVYTDGGHVHLTPLKSAIEAGCREIDVILTAPLNPAYMEKTDLKGTVRSSLRSIDIMSNTIWKKDLKTCHLVNRLVDEAGNTEYKKIKVTVYSPENHLLEDFFGALSFNKDLIQNLIQVGKKTEGLELEEFLETSKLRRLIPKTLH